MLDDLRDETPAYLVNAKWLPTLPTLQLFRCVQSFASFHVQPIGEYLIAKLCNWDEARYNLFVEGMGRKPLPLDSEIFDLAAIEYCHLHDLVYRGNIPEHPLLMQYLVAKGKEHLIPQAHR
jgi:hypothetical protein